MSTLLVDELFDGVTFEQPVTITRNISVAHVRPWVYIHGTLVDGDFQLEILDGATVLKTVTIPYTEINAVKTLATAHGFIRFDTEPLILNVPEAASSKEYILRFKMINHTTDAGNFLGIVRRWEAKTYPTYGTGVINNEAPNDSVEPAGLEIFEFTVV